LNSRPILKNPDARLRRKAEPITDFGEQLAIQINELSQAMGDGPGAVGIAAPQIGENIRLIIVDASLSLRPCKNHGRMVMLNPAIESMDGETLGREGCLSVPDWVGMVRRAKRITASYDDMQGNRQTINATGFEARVIQHEIDHLDGVLFIDRVVSSRDLMRRMADS